MLISVIKVMRYVPRQLCQAHGSAEWVQGNGWFLQTVVMLAAKQAIHHAHMHKHLCKHILTRVHTHTQKTVLTNRKPGRIQAPPSSWSSGQEAASLPGTCL